MTDNQLSGTGVEQRWPANPYPGLRPFLITEDGDESLIFFGRKEQIHDLLDRLGDNHFMAVLGPSGCGKSSLVKAGLIPALGSGLIYQAGANWVSAEAEPGSAPIRNLARAIAEALSRAKRKDAAVTVPDEAELTNRLYESTTALVDLAEELPQLLEDNTNLLVLVDQFEELFREDLSQLDEDAQLINLLLNVFNMRPDGLYVVITMRTDYLEQCATFHGLPEALNQSQFLTPRLNPQQLADAISGPVELLQYGGKVEPRLARKILSEMTGSSGYDPDLLPLMQHALFWMWRKAVEAGRKAGEPVELTLENYKELAGEDGLQGVLSRRADDIYLKRLDPVQQRIAECMFRLMSEVDDGARRRRRVTTPEEVAQNAGVELAAARAVIDIFADPAVSFIRWKDGGTTLDVTHESLIRKWGRLDGWALAERDDADEYRDLERSTEKWAEDDRATLTEAGLKRWDEFCGKKGNVGLWAARYGTAFDAVSQYVDVSRARVQEYKDRRERTERLQRETEEAVERERATRRRLMAVIGMTAVAFGLVFFAFYQRNQAVESREFAEAERIKAEGLQQLAETKSEELEKASNQLKLKKEEADQQRTLAEEQKLVAEQQRQEAENALERARLTSKELTQTSNRNRRLVGLALKAIALRRAAIVEKEVDQGRPATGLRLALDTKDIATDADHAFHLALARAVTAAPQPGPELAGRFGNISSVHWDEARNAWVVLWQNGVMHTFADPDTVLQRFKIAPSQTFVAGGLAPDGSKAVVVAQNDRVALLNADEGSEPVWLQDHPPVAKKAQFSEDGTIVATLTPTGSMGVWDAETGDFITHLIGVDVEHFALSKDGSRLVTVSLGRDAASGRSESAVRIWRLQPNAQFHSFRKLPGAVTALRFAAGNSTVAVGYNDGRITVLSDRGETLTELQGPPSSVRAFAASPDARFLASGNANRSLTVWELESRKAISLNRLARGNIRHLEFSPDGQTIMAGFLSELYQLKAGTAEVLKVVRSDGRPVALSPDSQLALSVGGEAESWLWNAQTGQRAGLVAKPAPGAHAVKSMFSFDGQRIATGFKDGTVQISNAGDGSQISVHQGRPGTRPRPCIQPRQHAARGNLSRQDLTNQSAQPLGCHQRCAGVGANRPQCWQCLRVQVRREFRLQLGRRLAVRPDRQQCGQRVERRNRNTFEQGRGQERHLPRRRADCEARRGRA